MIKLKDLTYLLPPFQRVRVYNCFTDELYVGDWIRHNVKNFEVIDIYTIDVVPDTLNICVKDDRGFMNIEEEENN